MNDNATILVPIRRAPAGPSAREESASRPWPTCPVHGDTAVRWVDGWVFCRGGIGWHEDGAR